MDGLSIIILISTIGKRIERVPEILLEPRKDISYIISWQIDEDTANFHTTTRSHNEDNPTAIYLRGRNDVKVFPIHGRGLSANRNNAIKEAQECTSDKDNTLLVLADDDIRLKSDWLNQLKALASAEQGVDLLILQALTPDGHPLHHYPDKPFVYPHVPKGFYFNSMGMVLRGGRAWPPFDTRFGLGAPVLRMGEEDIFIRDCYKEGLRISYYPQPLLITPAITTSSAYKSDSTLQMSKGAVLTLLHGSLFSLPRIFITAIKMRDSIPTLIHLRNMFKGWAYILKN